MTNAHVYEVRPRKDKRGVDLISDALPFGRLWYDGPNAASNAIGYASHYSRSHGAVIRVYDDVGNVIQAHEHPKQLQPRTYRRWCEMRFSRAERDSRRADAALQHLSRSLALCPNTCCAQMMLDITGAP